MNNKTALLIAFLAVSLPLSAQQLTKEDICKNWMVWNVSSPLAQGKTLSRSEMGQEPKADFVIESNGSFNIRFENIGKGTWRIEGDYIVFWTKDANTKNDEIALLAKVLSHDDEKMNLRFISQTKTYDSQVELVTFN